MQNLNAMERVKFIMTKDEKSYTKELIFKLKRIGWEDISVDDEKDLIIERIVPTYMIRMNKDYICFVCTYSNGVVLEKHEFVLLKRLFDMINTENDVNEVYEISKEVTL